MNRPELNDYALKDGAYSLKYVTDLEKYCDYLEQLSASLNEQLKIVVESASNLRQWYNEEKEKNEILEGRNYYLEKALSKACVHASCQFLDVKDMFCENNRQGHCPDCLMKHFIEEAQDE